MLEIMCGYLVTWTAVNRSHPKKKTSTWSSQNGAKPDSDVVCRIDGLAGLPDIRIALQTMMVLMYP
jgi:hypothetical protein